ncbi:hypothetical protein QBC35DRAFT_39561 [Podospora australis]|uniref:NmrA-like domain-containing protein n=1 Tax=Podospora australis TaxID=1536484 RepID=A0AAN6WNZ0_9PEZI|nr:hypothetical protein QBC35DRAFT_39561 [Podospora australis]
MMPADPSAETLLFTIGAGKQTVALLPVLIPKWKKIRLGIRSDKSLSRLQTSFPATEIIKTDLDNPNSVNRLIQGVSVVFHFGPSFHTRESDLGLCVIDAAAAINRTNPVTIKHFVLSSVVGSQLAKLPNHACKRPVEEALMESGLPYTILQPTFRMDVFPLRIILNQKPADGGPIVYKAAWRPEIKTSFVTLRGQSEAASVVLEERERHLYATYLLVSTPEPILYAEFVRRAVAVAGERIEVGYQRYEEAVALYLGILFGGEDKADPEVRDGLQRTLLYYKHRGLLGSSTQLEWLIGRKGETVEEWARGVLDL